MPPRKRPRPSDPEPIPSPSSVNQSNFSDNGADDITAPPFLNTTFTTHRVSPLFLGANPLTQARFDVLSARLRDLLVGDVVRGVEVGLDRGADDAAVMRRAGALELVAIGWVRMESLLDRYVGGGGGSGDVAASDPDESLSSLEGAGGATTPGRRRALHIALQYENTQCVAILLPSWKGKRGGSDSGDVSMVDSGTTTGNLAASWTGQGTEQAAGSDRDFLHLPLMLLRMPAPLRTVIIDFISRTFDCRITSLSLGTRSLVNALERWMDDSKVPTRGQFAKDAVLTLGFYGPAILEQQKRQQDSADKENQAADEEADRPKAGDSTLGIKSIDIIVPNPDLRRFVRAGALYEANRSTSEKEQEDKRDDAFDAAKRRRLGGDKDEESWTWRQRDSSTNTATATDDDSIASQPFTEALAQYVRQHLALDMFHPAVRVVKIACGGFVLSEGRVKIFGVPPGSEHALSDAQQKAVWSVMESLLERAQLKPVDRSLSSGTSV